MRRVKRVAEMLRNGNVPSANSASSGLRSDEHDDHRGHRQDARDRQRDQQHDLVDLLDVGVRVRHQLAGLRVVVEREVQALQVRDEAHAHIGFDAVREPERGVTSQAGAHGLHRTDDEDDRRDLHRGVVFARRDAFVDGESHERGDGDPGHGPDQARADTKPDQHLVRPNRRSHEAPAVPALPRVLRPPFPRTPPWRLPSEF